MPTTKEEDLEPAKKKFVPRRWCVLKMKYIENYSPPLTILTAFWGDQDNGYR